MRKLPWCGVAMKTTRVTYGWCSKNIVRWASARVSALHLRFVERNARVGIPEARAAVGDHEAGQQATLAVADHHDFVERGIEPVGVELLVNALQSLPQIGGGEQDGIVRVVGEEPELDPLAELRIVLELVDDIRPAGGARDRAVDEHDGHAAR